jgi:Family of unknown function (DUF5677)
MIKAPLKGLLDKDMRKVEIYNEIQIISPVLQNIVNYGTNVFGRCLQSTKHDGVVDMPDEAHLSVLLLYLHVIEMIDAIEVMVSQSVVIPVNLQLRSAFEAFLQLKWIFKEDTKQRAYAYLVNDVRNRIKFYQSLSPSSQSGKQLESEIAKDVWS